MTNAFPKSTASVEATPYVSREEAAHMLRVNDRTVDRWLKRGLLKRVPKHISRRVLISRQSVLDFIEVE